MDCCYIMSICNHSIFSWPHVTIVHPWLQIFKNRFWKDMIYRLFPELMSYHVLIECNYVKISRSSLHFLALNLCCPLVVNILYACLVHGWLNRGSTALLLCLLNKCNSILIGTLFIFMSPCLPLECLGLTRHSHI